MKRTLIALAVTAAVAAPLAAQAAPKVYGKLNLSVEQYKKDNANPATVDSEFSRTVSNASRFGVKGEDELTATLSAVYQIEWEVAADGEDATGATASTKLDLTQRNRFLGIKSQDYGTIKIGKFDSYTKLAQGEIDLFNDFEGDMKYVIAGETRLNNAVGYESPKFFDALTFNVLTQTQDASSTSGNAKNGKNGSSASVVYNNEETGLYAALAADFGIDGATALFGTRESDNLRAVISYKIADLILSGIYQTSDSSLNGAAGTNAKETGWQLGASYKIADETLKAQYGQADADSNLAATQQHTLWSVGVDHNFSSKTKAFAWYTEKKEDKLAVLADSDIKVFALGLEHKF